MSTIATMQFNWLPRPSLYAQAQAWTARQQALRQQTEDLASISDIFASASTDQTAGMVNLAAQAALNRTQAAAATKVNSVLGSSSDTSVSPIQSGDTSNLVLPDGTIIKSDPTMYLPGGSRLNLSAGTLTLPNGTVIDTTTGLKKVVDLSV